MSNLNINKINPAVKQLIDPIIVKMSEIDYNQKMNPTVGVLAYNEPAAYKEAKKSCVHITYDAGSNMYRSRVRKDPITGELKCEVCGRTIYNKFDNTAIDKIMECLDVINQLLFIGMVYGLTPDAVQTLISLKINLPIIAQMMKGLNDVIKMDNSSTESMSGIGSMYDTGSIFRSFTT